MDGWQRQRHGHRGSHHRRHRYPRIIIIPFPWWGRRW